MLSFFQIFSTLALFGYLSVGNAQVLTPEYELSTWSGAAYALPDGPKGFTDRKAFQEELLQGEYLETVKFDILNFPSSDPEDYFFPGTNLPSGWCTMLYATLDVKRAGCYELILNSDDGSILWLNDTLRVDNDGMHRMRMRKAKHYLDARTYTAKLWYLDAFPPLHGLEFTLMRLEDASACAKTRLAEPARISLAAKSLYASGSAELGPDAAASLDQLCNTLRGLAFTKLTITGHTDNVGGAAANKSLSLKRAAAVVKYLRDCVDLSEVQLKVLGEGASQPVADNNTEVGRAQNRRVDVVVE